MKTIITITLSEAVTLAMRRLSVIGKRNVDKQGNMQFADVTISTAEQPLLLDYAKSGAHSLIALLTEVVTDSEGLTIESQESSAGITIHIERTRWTGEENKGIPKSFEHACLQYVVSYICYEFLALTRADLAKKHGEDMLRNIANLKIQLSHKTEPQQSDKDYSDIVGTVV